MEKKNNLKTLIAWGLYEWASSSYFTIIQTFVFAVYFTQVVATNKVLGTEIWGLAMGLSGLVIAIASPLLGAIADQNGRRKLWLGFFTGICVLTTGLLWFIKPSHEYMEEGLILASIGCIAVELAFVYYNAMLPDIAPKDKIGLWSGIGWGMGYAGGMICLLLALFFSGIHNFWRFELDNSTDEPTRISFIMAAVWFVIFSIPLFFVIPDTKGQGKKPLLAMKDGIGQLKNSFKKIYHTHTFRFLIGRMIYIDGLTTLFMFGGIYAADTFQMTEHDVLIFAILLNITAGIGSLTLSWIDDVIGSKNLILISLTGLITLTIGILIIDSKQLFWTLGAAIGLFVGPLQASSRAFMAKITPPALMNQMFGFFAFSGKATTFFGPLIISGTIFLTHSQKAGMSTIIAFFIVGFLIMLTVPGEKKFRAEEREASLKV